MSLEGVGAVGVHLQGELRPGGSHRADRLDVATGFDLQLHPPVAVGHVGAHRGQQVVDRRLEPDGHAGVDRTANRAEVHGERHALSPQLGIEDGQLQRGLRHVVALDEGEVPGHVGGRQLVGRPAARAPSHVRITSQAPARCSLV